MDQLPEPAYSSCSFLPSMGLFDWFLIHSHFTLTLGFSWSQRCYQGFVQQPGKQPDLPQSGWEMLGPSVLKVAGNSTSRTHFIMMRGSCPGTQCCGHLRHSWSKYCEWISSVKALLCVGEMFLFLHSTVVLKYIPQQFCTWSITVGRLQNFQLLLPCNAWNPTEVLPMSLRL